MEINGSSRKPISSRKALRGLKWFIALSIFGLLLNFFLTSFAGSYRYLTQFNPTFLIIAFGLNVGDWVLGGARIIVLSAPLFSQITFKTCIKANVSNIFLGAVTPAQTGGGPAQIYVLYKNGMPFAEAAVASMICFICSMLFLISCAFYLSFFGHIPTMNVSLLLLSRVTLLVFSVIILLFAVAVVKPQTFESITRRCLSALPILKNSAKSGGKLQAFFDSVQKYQGLMRLYVSKRKLALLAAVCHQLDNLPQQILHSIYRIKGNGIGCPFYSNNVRTDYPLSNLLFFSNAWGVWAGGIFIGAVDGNDNSQVVSGSIHRALAHVYPLYRRRSRRRHNAQIPIGTRWSTRKVGSQ